MSQTDLARASGVPQPNLSAYENGRRTPSSAVEARLRATLAVKPSVRVATHREAIVEIVSRHHASAPRIFGSIARGEDDDRSDLDLLVEFTDEASLLDEIGLRLDLEDLLGISVDIVGADTLRGAFGERVRAEAVPV